MKKILYTVILLSTICSTAFAQDAMLEKDRLAVAVVKPIGITNENASTILVNNITQALTLNGLSAIDSRFVVIPNIALVSVNVTSTAPPKYVVELDVALFLGDLYTSTIMGQTSFSVKGVGNNESQAYITAVRNIQARNSKMKTMIITGKEKIMSYFDAQGEQILGRISAHIERKDYESAIIEAYAIPSACSDLYNSASALIAKIPVEKKKDIAVNETVVNNYYITEPKQDRITRLIK